MVEPLLNTRSKSPKGKALAALWVLAGIGLGIVLGWAAIRDVDWGSMQSAFGKVSWDVLLPAVAAVIVSIFLQAIRWKLMLPGESVSTARLFFVRNAGLSINNLMIGRGILGEASELTMLTKSDKIAGSKVVASLFMTRALDFAVTSVFLLAGFLVIPQLSVFRPVIVPVLSTAALVCVIMLLSKKIGGLPLLNRVKALESSLHAVAFLRNRQLRFWLSLSLTVATWMLLGTAAWLVAQAIGIQLPFWMMSILLVGIGLFASAIPSGPSSLGVYEFVTIYTLGLFAIDSSDALSFAVLIHALVVLPSIIIAIPTLFRERKTFPEVIAQFSALAKRRLLRRSVYSYQMVEPTTEPSISQKPSPTEILHPF